MGNRAFVAALLFMAGTACKPRSAGEAEAKKDVTWLADNGSPESVQALGRLADNDPRAVAALEARASYDINVYIDAWEAVTRGAAWGSTFLRAGLGDPMRAEMAATAMPRRDTRLAPFAQDLENAVVRLSAGHRGAVVASVLASIGPSAHPAVERRLVDPKTRGAMCDGIGGPDASGDAKSLMLAVQPESRDNASCVRVVLGMAVTENVVLDWLATTAEPGLLTSAAKGDLPCARLAIVWQRALVERDPAEESALTVPLGFSLHRCTETLESVLGELLTKAPRSRSCILQAIEPFGGDLAECKQICKALALGWANGESPRNKDRADDALSHGCQFVR